MLKRFRVDNFKSLINVVFEPGQVNLLTGRNNSGKTTLCQAMRLAQLSVFIPISNAAQAATGDVWNLTNAYLKKNTVSLESECDLSIDDSAYAFVYTLSFSVSRPSGPAGLERICSVESERLTVSGGEFAPETVLLDNQCGAVKLLHEGKYLQKQPDTYVETTAPTNLTMLNRLYDLEHNRLANAFKRYLGSWLYYDMDTTKLRNAEAQQLGALLNWDGSNLSHVLFQLKSFDERRYRRFVEVVKEIEPKMEALNFLPPTQESVYMTLTDRTDHRFSTYSMSNGTLRFMAMAYVVLATAAASEAIGGPPPVVTIEEPENGIYVGHLRRLVELTEPAGESSPQFIFSSHSPYFIDLFDQHLDGVFVMKSNETHSELIRPGAERLASVVKDFDLGEAHFRELLG